MATIFQETRIREKQGRKNPLAYTPSIPLQEALPIHESIWGCLPTSFKPLVTSKWINHAIETIQPLFESYKGRPGAKRVSEALAPILESISDQQFQSVPKKAAGSLPKAVSEISLESPLENLFKAFNTHLIIRDWAKELPRYLEAPKAYEALLIDLIETRSLMTEVGGKEPKPAYQAYLSTLDDTQRARARQVIIQVQTFLKYSDHWVNFYAGIGNEKATGNRLIAESVHYLDGYAAYRAGNKGGYEGKGISYSALSKELGWFRKALGWFKRSGIGELSELIEYMDSEDFNPTAIHTGKRKEDKPLSVSELKSLFGNLFKSIGETNHGAVKKSRTEIYLGSLWLLMSGCRPSELGGVQLEADRDHFQIYSGKTAAAERTIEATPAMLSIWDSMDFSTFGKEFGNRLEHYFSRLGMDSINSYRFRHSHASIQFAIGEKPYQRIALDMGHRDIQTTIDHYVKVSKYTLNKDTKAALKGFWERINRVDPMEPGSLFRVSKGN